MITWSKFSWKALDFIANSNARLNILHGSVRSSKTVNCSVRWLDYLVTGPKGDLMMVGKTRASLQRNVLNDIFDTVGESHYHWVDKPSGELELCGRRIYCIGANDEKSEAKIRGATIAGAYCDEVSLYPESFFVQLMARMSIPGAQCFCNTNPDNPFHWFNVGYIENEAITNKKVWHFTMDDNLNLDEEYKTSLAQMYSGVWYKRLILGLWVVAEGLIYDMVRDEIHRVPTVPRNYTKYYVTIDYGTQNPCAFLLMGQCEGKWYIVKEYYYSGREHEAQRTDAEYSADLKEFIGDLPYSGIIVDPSASSFIAQMKKDGFKHIIKACNDVMNGLRHTATAFMKQMIMINDCCTNTLKEVYSYIWDKRAAEHGEDKPLKQNDHAMDALRYFVETIMIKRGISGASIAGSGL